MRNGAGVGDRKSGVHFVGLPFTEYLTSPFMYLHKCIRCHTECEGAVTLL